MSEHQEQVALIKWARLKEKQSRELSLLYAIPNGGHRNKATAAKMKAEGVLPGMPDLCLPVARHGYHSLYIELKNPAPKKGRLTQEQKEKGAALREEGHRVEVCYGWVEAAAVIIGYLGWQSPSQDSRCRTQANPSSVPPSLA